MRNINLTPYPGYTPAMCKAYSYSAKKVNDWTWTGLGMEENPFFCFN